MKNFFMFGRRGTTSKFFKIVSSVLIFSSVFLTPLSVFAQEVSVSDIAPVPEPANAEVVAPVTPLALPDVPPPDATSPTVTDLITPTAPETAVTADTAKTNNSKSTKSKNNNTDTTTADTAASLTSAKTALSAPLAASSPSSPNVGPTNSNPSFTAQVNFPKVENTSGALTQSIQIIVPSGRSGLQPNVALNYNSQSLEDSIVGYGWNINIPYIERINRRGTNNLYSDKYFSSSVSGELTGSATVNEYIPKVQNSDFLRYKFIPTLTGGNWIVYDKSGTKYTYGLSAGSRQDDTNDTSKVSKWMIEEIRDVNDNYIRFEYYKDVGQIYPSKIYYTGSGVADGIFTVEFVRESRPDVGTSYKTSFLVQTNYRINQIVSKVNGVMVHQYNLAFSSGSNTKRSLLSSVVESAQDEAGQGLVTLPPITLEYTNDPVTFAYHAGGTNLDNVSGPFRVLADVDGNGLLDQVVSFTGNSFQVTTNYINRNLGSSNSSAITKTNPTYFDEYWATPYNGPGGYYPNEKGVRFFDVNGDGYSDVIKSEYNVQSSSYNQVLRMNDAQYSITGNLSWNNSTTTFSTPPFNVVASNFVSTMGFFGNLNGDGFVDFDMAQTFFSTTENGAYFGNGAGFDQNRTLFSPHSNIPNAGNLDTTAPRLVDVNGDGLDDWLSNFNPVANFCINTGLSWSSNCSSAYSLASTTVDISGNDLGVRFIDINGDGLLDYVRSYNMPPYTMVGDGTNPPPAVGSFNTVMLNTGSGWVQSNITLPFTIVQYDVYAGMYTGVVLYNEMWDKNGDGLAENTTYDNLSHKPDVLKKITYPTGGNTSITYEPTTSQIANGIPKHIHLPMSLNVVTAIVNNDVNGNQDNTTYNYENGSMYFAGPYDKKFAGFEKITKTNSSAVVDMYYHQGNGDNTSYAETGDSYGKIGNLYRVDVFDKSGNLITRTQNIYGETQLANQNNLGGNIYSPSTFVYLSKTVEESYDTDGSHQDKATENTYDLTNANLLSNIQYGQVSSASTRSVASNSFTDIDTDKIVTNYTYASNPVTTSQPIISRVYASSGDGSVNYFSASGGDTFYTVRNAQYPGGSITSTVMDSSSVSYGAFINAIDGVFWIVSRAFIPIDTTSIPSNANIISATLGISGLRAGGATTISLVPSSQTSSTALTAGDYSKIRWDKLADDKDVSGLSSTAHTVITWPLNSNGLVNLVPGAVTKLAIVTNGDFNNSPEYSGIQTGFVDINTSRAISDKPYLDVTYSTSTASVRYAVSSAITTDQNGTKVKESKFYYDNLPFGQLSNANQTKSESWITSTTYASSTKTYNSFGLVTSQTDPRGNKTNYTYDTNNLFVATVTNPLLQNTSYVYNYAVGKPKQVTDPNGRVFQTTYDGLGRVIEQKQPDTDSPTNLVTKTQYVYTDSGFPTKVQEIDFLGPTLSIDKYLYFDGLGRKIQERVKSEASNTYSTKDYVYDANGNVAKESLPYFSNGSAWTTPTAQSSLYNTYTYDALNRVTRISNSVGVTTNEYHGWFTTNYDPRGVPHDYYKNAFGSLIGVIEFINTPQGRIEASTNYTYDASQNLVGIKDALNNVRSFAYDGLGRRTSAQDLHAPADSTFGTYSYAYDLAGNLSQKTDPKGQVVNYTYDALNRQLTEDYTGQAGTEVTYTYDNCIEGKTRMCSATSVGAVISNSYDALGQIKISTSTISGTNLATKFIYDRVGNQTLVTYPDNSQVSYIYNSAGLLDSVKKKESTDSQFSDVVTNIDYSPTGDATLVAYANGVNSQNVFDSNALYRLTNRSTVLPNQSHVQDLAYTYDPNGNITKVVDGSSSVTAKTSDYTYDDLSRLTIASTTNAVSGTNYLQNFAYDVLGNIISGPAGTYSYLGNSGSNYANPHAVTAILGGSGSKTSTYDQNGNLLSDGTFTYVWDYRNRLVQSGNGIATSTYAYDHDVNRVKLVEGGVTSLFPNKLFNTVNGLATTTKHLFAGGMLVGTVDSLPGGTTTTTTSTTTVTKIPITLDTTSSSVTKNNVGTTTKSWTHTIGGTGVATSTIIVLTADLLQPTPGQGNIASVKWNGAPFTKVASKRTAGMSSEIWYLVATTTGAKTLAVTINGQTTSQKLFVATLKGVSTTTPLSGSNISGGSSGNPNITLTISSSGELMISTLSRWTTTDAISTATSIFKDKVTVLGATSYLIATTSKPYTDTYVGAVATDWSMVTASFKPATISVTTSTTTSAVANASVTTRYVHTDNLTGSNVITDSSANVVETLDYYPYGGVRTDNKQVGYVGERRKYAGTEFDNVSGLNYMMARYYNSTRGQFISEDPVFWSTQQNLSDPQSFNSYSYANDNPINRRDPTGLSTQTAVKGASIETAKLAISVAAMALFIASMPVAIPATVIAATAIAVSSLGIAATSIGAYKNYQAYSSGSISKDQFDYNNGGLAVNGLASLAGLKGGISLFNSIAESKILYHYTNEVGMNGIIESGKLNPSLKANNPKDTNYGDGQYLTDIVPGNKSNSQLGAIFKNRPNKYLFTNYVSIDVSGFNVVEGRANVFVIPGQSQLDISGRIKGWGFNQ